MSRKKFDVSQHPDLTRYTEVALKGVRDENNQAITELVASVTAETISDDELAELESYRAFDTSVSDEIQARTDRAARFASATTVPAAAEGSESAPAAEATEPVTASGETTETAPPAPSIGEVAATAPAPTTAPATTEPRPMATLVASGDIPGVRINEPIDMDTFTEAFMSMSGAFEAMGARGQNVSVSRNIATIRRNYPEHLKVYGASDEYDQKTLLAASDETKLQGGSLRASKRAEVKKIVDAHVAKGGQADEIDALTAAGGWCAPSVTVYDTCFQTVVDGIYDGPEVQAPRGGVRHNTGLDWSTIYGGGNILGSANGVTGFWNRTEAQVSTGSPVKDSIQVACPTFVDTRLGVTGLWITSPILTNRAYPEFVRTFMEGAMAVHAHQMNALRIQAIVAGSTGVILNTDPFVSDGTVTSNLLSAVEMAIVDLKYRLRLARNATLEVVLPFWVRAQFRADLSRRTGYDVVGISASDAQIDAWFAMRGANVQFVYDWQDAFTSATAGLPGNATAIQALPVTTQFLVYPTGTWVTAVQDVITLNAIYDTNATIGLPVNVMTQLFAEDGWAVLQMCPVSRVYTVPTCPSGSTTAPSQVDCVTP